MNDRHRGDHWRLLLMVLVVACSQESAPPSFPITVSVTVVNDTTDSVFVRMAADESAYPGISRVAPSDSQCTELYAWADSVPIEVHSWTNGNTIYGTAWVFPLRGASWQVTVSSSGVTAKGTNKGCTV